MEAQHNPHILSTVETVKRFMLAGNARLTLVSKVTGERFTYRIRATNPAVCFVSLLIGPNNENAYEFLGTIFDSKVYRQGRKSSISRSAPSAQAFDWFFRALSANVLPGTVEVWHEGRCGRCARPLTVPESIATGFGPECAELMGLTKAPESTS